MCFLSTAFKIEYGLLVGDCRKISLTSIAYSGDKEPTMYLNRINLVVMFLVLICASTCINHSCRLLGQNGSSFIKTTATDEAG